MNFLPGIIIAPPMLRNIGIPANIASIHTSFNLHLEKTQMVNHPPAGMEKGQSIFPAVLRNKNLYTISDNSRYQEEPAWDFVLPI